MCGGDYRESGPIHQLVGQHGVDVAQVRHQGQVVRLVQQHLGLAPRLRQLTL